MFHHDFILHNYTVWVRGDVSKLEAFASICPVRADQLMVLAFVMNFPGATPLDYKELDKLPHPPSGTVKVVCRPMGPFQAPQSCHAQALYFRDEQVVPAAVLQALDRLQPGAGWSMVALRQQEDLHLPSIDYSLTNSMLLPQMCLLLLQKTGQVAAQGRQAPPTQQATLTGLHAYGYQPCSRLNISTKISLIDFERLWFPLEGSVPRCTDMLTWLELPKAVDAEWVPKRMDGSPPTSNLLVGHKITIPILWV